jgi:hypothetical protein
MRQRIRPAEVFRITYHGGAGNDVVFLCLSVPQSRHSFIPDRGSKPRADSLFTEERAKGIRTLDCQLWNAAHKSVNPVEFTRYVLQFYRFSVT